MSRHIWTVHPESNDAPGCMTPVKSWPTSVSQVKNGRKNPEDNFLGSSWTGTLLAFNCRDMFLPGDLRSSFPYFILCSTVSLIDNFWNADIYTRILVYQMYSAYIQDFIKFMIMLRFGHLWVTLHRKRKCVSEFLPLFQNNFCKCSLELTGTLLKYACVSSSNGLILPLQQSTYERSIVTCWLLALTYSAVFRSSFSFKESLMCSYSS